MEVDTGAGVSLAPEVMLLAAKLEQTDTILKSYTGQRIPVKGSISINVDYGQTNYKNLKLLVVQGSGLSLMGHDWLRVVRLDWRTIGRVATSADGVDKGLQ